MEIYEVKTLYLEMGKNACSNLFFASKPCITVRVGAVMPA